MSNMAWHLIHCKAHQENVAEVNLRRLGLETYCPRLDQKCGLYRTQRKEEILFPGYVFVKVDMTKDFRKVTYSHGVRRVVKFGAVPAIVEDHMIESIRQRIYEGLFLLPTGPSLEFGQIVRINKGPFDGFQAVFEQHLNATQRVALLLKTVAFQGRIIVDRHCVGLS